MPIKQLKLKLREKGWRSDKENCQKKLFAVEYGWGVERLSSESERVL